MVRNTGLTLICTATVSASATTPTQAQVTIKTSPHDSGNTEVFIPITENWVLTDMYIISSADSGTSDPIIEFIKDRGVTMGSTVPLSTELVTNNTRPRFLPSPIGFEAGTILSATATSTIDNDATVDNIKFFVSVDIT